MVDLTGSVLAATEAAAPGFDARMIGVAAAVLASGLVIVGAAHGIGKIASSATEAIARQPEAGGRIFTSMLLASAFIEGGMLFALIVCFLAMWRLSS